MSCPDAIHFTAVPLNVSLQSRPTHLFQVGWSDGDYNMQWVVMLRADGSTVVLDSDPAMFRDNAYNTALRTLAALGIEVKGTGVDLGRLPPAAPFNFAGLHPGDRELRDILARADFMAWLKERAEPLPE